MKLIRVTEDTLASILIMDRRLEEYPEPYRSNKDIDIEVSFETYKNSSTITLMCMITWPLGQPIYGTTC